MDVEDVLLTDSNIKTEEIDIKYEPIGDEMIFEIPCDIKKEWHEEGDTPSHSQNDFVGTRSVYDVDELKATSAESTSSNYYGSEERIHETTTETGGDNRKTQSRHCGKSQVEHVMKSLKVKKEYNTQYAINFTQHQLVHKDLSAVRKYECEEQKDHLETHQLLHKDLSEVRIYECDECDYKSVRKGHLRTHQLRHKDPSEVRMYECDVCDYKSLQKAHLKSHQLRHKDSCDLQKYECDVCDFKSVHKSSLKTHQLRHKDPCDVQTYECDECDYKCLHKANLKTHKLRHKDPCDVHVYGCGECDYKSLRKSYLKAHQLKHKDPSE